MADLQLKSKEVRKLLGAGNGDAALLYLCTLCGGTPEAYGLSGRRFDCAAALLRQLGLWQEQTPKFQQNNERPVYTEADIARQLTLPRSGFQQLVGETQRRLGKVLNNEELKVLLSLTDYLGLSEEVISMLLSYCIDRSRSRGAGRAPSFRSIEKEAYRWADEGICDIESAAAYVQAQNFRRSRIGAISEMMGLDGRRLSPSEEKYLHAWLELGFGLDALQLAYDKTCENTGGLKWPYMNSIVCSWDAQGLHTLAEIQSGDRPGERKDSKRSGYEQQGTPGSQLSRKAAARLLAESKGD